MSDNVKLTMEEAKALERVVRSRVYGKREVLMEHGNYCVSRPKEKDPYWEGDNAPLNKLDFDTMAKALYSGYEVETPEDRATKWLISLDCVRGKSERDIVMSIKAILEKG